MTIHLPDDLERFIQAQVESGQFATEDEAIVEAVRRVKRWEQEEATKPVPAWKQVLEQMKDIPDAVFDQIPADSSEQLDHYLYGTPRRPTS